MTIVGKWGLNGDSNALVGPNGTDTSITYVDGKSNLAASFNGSTSYITIPSNTIFDFGASYFISTLIYINTLPTTGNLQTIFYRKNTAGTGAQFELVLFNDGGTQKVFVSQATTFNPINYTLPTGKWIYLSVGYSSNTITFYLDGVSIGTVTQATQCGTSNKVFDFGRNSTGIRYLNGLLDEVKIYNIALSPAEIKNDYLFYNGFI